MAMVYEIARKAGQKVRSNSIGAYSGPLTFEMLKTVAQAYGADVFTASLEPGQSGMIIKYAGSDPRIYISDSEPVNRQLFTLAHEIGHLIERRDIARDDEYGYVDHRDEETKNLREFYANEFAGELLMPAEKFLEEVKESSVEQAAAKFNVSVPAARERYRRLQVHPA